MKAATLKQYFTSGSSAAEQEYDQLFARLTAKVQSLPPDTPDEAAMVSDMQVEHKGGRLSFWTPDAEFFVTSNLRTVAPGVRAKLLTETPQVSIVYWEIDAGSGVAAHKHTEFVETMFVASGELRMTTDEGTKTYTTGDCFTIPSGVFHEGSCIVNSVIITTARPPFK